MIFYTEEKNLFTCLNFRNALFSKYFFVRFSKAFWKVGQFLALITLSPQ